MMGFGPAEFGPAVKPTFVNEQSINALDDATSRALAKLNYRYTPVGGNGLYALTSPIAYIYWPDLTDPFGDGYYTWGGSNWGGFGSGEDFDPTYNFVNFTQINPEGHSIARLGNNLPYLIYSNSPNTTLKLFPYPPFEPYKPYDPTNGTVSDGTIYHAP
jgi:hypothetical protein